MNSCFLDTCALLQILAGGEEVVRALDDFDEVMISHIVLGELIFGIHRSSNPEEERDRLLPLLSTLTVVTASPETASIYGELAADLEERVARIPQNDLWIAAVCVQCELPLISNDNHFSRLPRLRWVSY